MINNEIKALNFDLWLNENKLRYFKTPVQILADEDGMFSRSMTAEEREIYNSAHADYVRILINEASSGKTQPLNELWNLVKRRGMSEHDYYNVKAYYNGEKRRGHTDADCSYMGDL